MDIKAGVSNALGCWDITWLLFIMHANYILNFKAEHRSRFIAILCKQLRRNIAEVSSEYYTTLRRATLEEEAAAQQTEWEDLAGCLTENFKKNHA